MSDIGSIPELAREWLRSRPQHCATCGDWLAGGLPCVACEADGWYAEAVAWYALTDDPAADDGASDGSGSQDGSR